jgi:hypothetical protein
MQRVVVPLDQEEVKKASLFAVIGIGSIPRPN